LAFAFCDEIHVSGNPTNQELAQHHPRLLSYDVSVSRKKLVLAVTVGVIGLLVLIAWSPWSAPRFSGDGRLSDNGFFSYPRYVLTLPDMPLYESGERRFHLQGLPNEEMTLLLYVKGSSGSGEERSRLTKLPVSIDAVLTDSHGKEVCKATGRPADSNEDGIWVLMSGGDAAYWLWRCNHVQTNSNESYNLLIRVVGAAQSDQKVVVTPIFNGGGLELPSLCLVNRNRKGWYWPCCRSR
jgi:hypothetical protein